MVLPVRPPSSRFTRRVDNMAAETANVTRATIQASFGREPPDHLVVVPAHSMRTSLEIVIMVSRSTAFLSVLLNCFSAIATKPPHPRRSKLPVRLQQNASLVRLPAVRSTAANCDDRSAFPAVFP